MKKTIMVTLAIALCLVCGFSLFACGNSELNFGKDYIAVNAQSDILTELNSKTSDIGVMDSVMAGYYMLNSEYANSLMTIENCSLADENYGIAGRKGTEFIDAINQAIVDLSKSGKVGEIAAAYGLTDVLCVDATASYEVDETEADYAAIKAKGEFVVGYTLFAPIAYENGSGSLIGFDIDLAKAVGAKLGLNVKFQEIDWETKEVELNSKAIDLIWNGMTITEERQASMEVSAPYLKNKQVAVIRKADKDVYTSDTATWAKAIMTAEAGSAGEECIKK